MGRVRVATKGVRERKGRNEKRGERDSHLRGKKRARQKCGSRGRKCVCGASQSIKNMSDENGKAESAKAHGANVRRGNQDSHRQKPHSHQGISPQRRQAIKHRQDQHKIFSLQGRNARTSQKQDRRDDPEPSAKAREDSRAWWGAGGHRTPGGRECRRNATLPFFMVE